MGPWPMSRIILPEDHGLEKAKDAVDHGILFPQRGIDMRTDFSIQLYARAYIGCFTPSARERPDAHPPVAGG